MKQEANKIILKDWCPCINPFDEVNLKIIEQFGNGDFEELPCYEHFRKTPNPCVSVYGSIDKKWMILGQNPYIKEEEKDEPFVGDSGIKLWSVLKDLGFEKEDFYVTNALKCKAKTEDIKARQVKVCSLAILRRELAIVQPELIICLGKIAFEGLQYALFGRIKYKYERGSIYTFESPILKDRKIVKVCCTHHPSKVLRQPHLEPIFAKDLSIFLRGEGTTDKIKYHFLNSYEKIEKFVEKVKLIAKEKDEMLIAFDLETYSKEMFDRNNKIFCIGIALDEKEGYLIPLRYYDNFKQSIVTYFVESVQDKVRKKVLELFSIENLKLLGHNINFDITIMERDFGIDLSEKIKADTLILHHLLREQPPHDLKTLAVLYTPYKTYYTKIKETFKLKDWYKHADWDELFEYCAYDCCVCFYLYKYFMKRIKLIAKKQKLITQKLKSLIESYAKVGKEYIHPLYTWYQIDWLAKLQTEHCKIVYEMQKNGLPFSKSYISVLKTKVEEQLQEKIEELNKVAGTSINWNSPQQLTKLFKSLGIDSPIKTSKGNPSFNEEALNILAERGVTLAQKLLEYRKVATNYSKYVKMLSKYKDRLVQTPDSDIVRLSCKINIAGTETGRISTSDPALHQIPRDNLYRNMVVAEEGWVIVSPDYSMADLRVLAAYANCKSMLKAFEEGHDFHRYVASTIFGKDMDEVTTEERSKAKSVSFGIPYLISAKKLAQKLKVTEVQAKLFIAKWFEDKKEVKIFIDMLRKRYAQAQEGEEVVYYNIFGRARRVIRVKKFFESLDGKRRYNYEYGHIEREIVNFYPQSTVADALTISLVRLKRLLKKYNLRDKVRILLTIHDALLLEVKVEYVEQVKKLVKEAMEFPIKFPYYDLILPIDFTIDRCWKKE